MKKPKAVIVSGYFNPLHKGHIDFFKKARFRGDRLIVIINNDRQRKLKGSKEFQLEDERLFILEHLYIIDECFLSVDLDLTVNETIKKIYYLFSYYYDLVFANGGGQNNDTIPERSVCDELGIELLDGLGEKIQSSSRLLE